MRAGSAALVPHGAAAGTGRVVQGQCWPWLCDPSACPGAAAASPEGRGGIVVGVCPVEEASQLQMNLYTFLNNQVQFPGYSQATCLHCVLSDVSVVFFAMR